MTGLESSIFTDILILMARTARLVIPNMPHHIIQSGNDRQSIFRDDADYLAFQAWLKDAARQFRVALHAYVLLPNQVHLLATPVDETGLARMMQWVGRYYVPYFNQKYSRSGTLWQGRFKTSVIESEQYFLPCSRYIEMKPVRTGLAANPADYRWSSFAHHVGDRPDSMITDHPLYWGMGNTPFEREAAYKAWILQPVPDGELDALSSAVAKGWALGSDEFKIALERRTSRRVRPGKKGRPRKQADGQSAEPSLGG
ncbi:MAG: transposase [Burkholderiaceae bacterium]|nr:transposase [Burkholderiaceae bacterium]